MSVMLSLADKMTRECPSKPEHWKWEIQTLPPLQTEEKKEPKSFILVSTFAGVSGLQKFKENQFLIILQNMKTKPSNDIPSKDIPDSQSFTHALNKLSPYENFASSVHFALMKSRYNTYLLM